MNLGVTSIHSSCWIYSIHSSSVINVLGAIRVASSLPLARWLVSFFASVAFTTRSPGLIFSAMIWPAYTSSPGSTKNVPCPVIYRLNNRLSFPVFFESNTPLFLPGIGPFHGLYSVKRCAITASPAVVSAFVYANRSILVMEFQIPGAAFHLWFP